MAFWTRTKFGPIVGVAAGAEAPNRPPGTGQFGYDATEDDGRRKASYGPLVGEDRVLHQGKRKKLVGNARDLYRNFAIASWAVRKHLDYVSSFSFQVMTDDDKFNNQLESLMKEFNHRSRCDVAGRHPLRRLIRLGEARRTVDGDLLFLKINQNQGMLQAIEADRMRNAYGEKGSWINGVKVNEYGRALAYCIHPSTQKQTPSGKHRVVPAHRAFHHAYWDRIEQYRGISPLSSGLNSLRDVYENFNYALAKAKVSQLFGLVTKRGAEDPLGTIEGGDDDDSTDDKLTVDFGGGPFHLDLDIEDDAEILESRTPATEFQNFTQSMILVALKALDIPYSFYDESFTNFYGSRGGLIQYIQSCKSKRLDNIDLLTEITRWKMALWILEGRLVLPPGKTIYDINFQWIPDGVPWWDPVKEVAGNRAAIESAFTNPQAVCRMVGTDFKENIDQIAEALSYAGERGVPLSFTASIAKGATKE